MIKTISLIIFSVFFANIAHAGRQVIDFSESETKKVEPENTSTETNPELDQAANHHKFRPTDIDAEILDSSSKQSVR